MIKRCDINSKEELLNYLRQEKEMNLFFIGDIEIYGFDCDFQHIYVDKIDNEIKTVYLIFHKNLLVYSNSDYIDFSVFEKIYEEYHVCQIMGKVELLNLINEKYSNKYNFVQSIFSKLDDKTHLVDTSDVEIIQAQVEDAPALSVLLDECFEGKAFYPENMIYNRIKSKEARHYFIKVEDQIICHANSAVEVKDVCMIGGVATLAQYRNKGYATKVVSKLCNDLLSENITPCLFYNDEEAGRIYTKLGFKQFGYWGTLSEK